MVFDGLSTEVSKQASALGLASSIGEVGSHCLGLGPAGVGGAIGATTYLINKVVSSQFNKYVPFPERDFSDPIDAVSKISAYGMAYAASKVVVLALTIASSYAVASALGMVATASALGSLASSGAGLTAFTSAAYLVGAAKGGIWGQEETWDYDQMNSWGSVLPEPETRCPGIGAPPSSNNRSWSNNPIYSGGDRLWNTEARRGNAFSIDDGAEAPMVTPVNQRIEELRAEDRDEGFSQNLARAFREGRAFRGRRNELRRSEIPRGPKIGSLRMPTERQAGRVTLDDSHYSFEFPLTDVPNEDWNYPFIPHVLILGKARELGVEIPYFSRIGPEILNPSHDVLFTRNHQNMYKKILKFLIQKENEALTPTIDPVKIRQVHDQWRNVLEHLEAGSGDCPDPVREQIEQLYHSFFSEEREHLATFEEKVQQETRILRDSLFREACTEVIHAYNPDQDEFATPYEYLKSQLRTRFNLTPGDGSFFNSSYPEYTSRVIRKFQSKYTADRIIQHLRSKKDNGKDRIGVSDIQSWLCWKSGASVTQVGTAIMGGLDEETYMPRSEVPTKAAWVMILRNLDKPVIHSDSPR